MARILVADDERGLLDLMERVLGKRGHEVETFLCGDEAVEAVQSNEYDLVLTDLRMPGKTGLDVLEAAKARRPKLPVLIVSGSTEPEDRARAEALGVYMMLHKPVDLAYLMTIIESALEESLGATAAGSAPPAAPATASSAPPAAAEPNAGKNLLVSHATLTNPSDTPPAPPANSPALPTNSPASPPPAQDPTASPLAPAALVRVVEREACLANLIAYCLRRQGYRVTTGPSEGAAAVTIVGDPSGVEAARKDAPGAVLIALYSDGAVDAAVRALNAGADIALARPFEPELLFAHVLAAARRAGHAAKKAPVARDAAPADGLSITRSRLAAVRN